MVLTTRSWFFLLLAWASIALSGCRDQDFQGDLTLVGTRLPVCLEREPVHLHVDTSRFEASATITIHTSAEKAAIEPWTVRRIDADHYDVFIPQLRRRPFHFAKVASDSHCYESRRLYWAEFCHNDVSLRLDIKSLDQKTSYIHLLASAADAPHEEAQQVGRERVDQGLDLEGPYSFTLREAFERMLAKNFDIQEASYGVAQARARAERSYRLLAPHISSDSALALVAMAGGGGFQKAAKAADEVVPFLFPGRWLKAGESSWRAKAERLGLTLTQYSNLLALQAHALTFRADIELKAELKLLRTELEKSLVTAFDLKQRGFLDESSTLTFEIALNDLNVALREVTTRYTHERLQISTLLGFQNPLAVEEITLGLESTRAEDIPRLKRAPMLAEMHRSANLAVANSFELSQLHFLGKAAELGLGHVLVNWLDVSGTDGLGWHQGSEWRMAQAELATIEVRRNRVRSLLRAKTYRHVLYRNLFKQNFEVNEASLEHRRRRLTLLLEGVAHCAENIASQGDRARLIASDIRSAVKDTIAGLESYYTSRAALEVEQAELDRLLLNGPYAEVLTRL